jgi:hypothetical protein
MHHKRGRARNRRAGCKLCKPWKVNGVRTESKDGESFSDHQRRLEAIARLVEADTALSAEMAEWETAMIGDGLDERDR